MKEKCPLTNFLIEVRVVVEEERVKETIDDFRQRTG